MFEFEFIPAEHNNYIVGGDVRNADSAKYVEIDLVPAIEFPGTYHDRLGGCQHIEESNYDYVEEHFGEFPFIVKYSPVYGDGFYVDMHTMAEGVGIAIADGDTPRDVISTILATDDHDSPAYIVAQCIDGLWDYPVIDESDWSERELKCGEETIVDDILSGIDDIDWGIVNDICDENNGYITCYDSMDRDARDNLRAEYLKRAGLSEDDL